MPWFPQPRNSSDNQPPEEIFSPQRLSQNFFSRGRKTRQPHPLEKNPYNDPLGRRQVSEAVCSTPSGHRFGRASPGVYRGDWQKLYHKARTEQTRASKSTQTRQRSPNLLLPGSPGFGKRNILAWLYPPGLTTPIYGIRANSLPLHMVEDWPGGYSQISRVDQSTSPRVA